MSRHSKRKGSNFYYLSYLLFLFVAEYVEKVLLEEKNNEYRKPGLNLH